MTRKDIDCRDAPAETNCTVAISADDAQELDEAAVQHAVAVHHHDDGPELRRYIRAAMRGAPVDEAVAPAVARPAGAVDASGQGAGCA